MNLNQSRMLMLKLITLVVGVVIYCLPLHAEEAKDGLVEVEVPQDVHAEYLERRSKNGFLFGLNYEYYLPKNYNSVIDSTSYGTMYSDNPMYLIGFDLSYKRNFDFISMAIGIGYAGGSISGSDSGSSRSLDLQKYSLRLDLILDTLSKEPLVVPYMTFGVTKIGYKDSQSDSSQQSETAMGYQYKLGALIQLNKLDEQSSQEALNNSGLENLFLDVYATQYITSSSEVDLASPLSFGAGLKFEF